MDADFNQKLFTKIKEEKITPKPRWQFLLKDYVIVLTGLLAVLFGAASFAVLAYLFRFNDFEVYEATHKTLAEFFLLTLPYFWIIFLGLFVFIAYYNLKHTKHGYRYPVYLVVIGAVGVSLILGTIFIFLGWGPKVDSILGRSAPFYHEVFNPQMSFWSNPVEGRLIGIVSEKADTDSFTIIEPGGKSWLVEINTSSTAFISPMHDLMLDMVKVGQPIRLIGTADESGKFIVDMIRPIEPGKDFLKKRFKEHGPINFDDHACRPGICPKMMPGVDSGKQFGPPPIPRASVSPLEK